MRRHLSRLRALGRHGLPVQEVLRPLRDVEQGLEELPLPGQRQAQPAKLLAVAVDQVEEQSVALPRERVCADVVSRVE